MTPWEIRYAEGGEFTPIALMRDGYDVLPLGESCSKVNAELVTDSLNDMEELGGLCVLDVIKLLLSIPIRVAGSDTPGATRYYETDPTGPHVDAIAAMRERLCR